MKREFTDTICDVEVQVTFRFSRFTHREDVMQFGELEIEDIQFFVENVDITDLVLDMSSYDFSMWESKCIDHINL